MLVLRDAVHLKEQPRSPMNKLVLTVLLSTVPLFCADEALPKAETLMDHFVEVTGGKATFEKHQNEVMHGTMELTAQGIKGTITVYQAAPDKTRAVIELDAVGKIESGSDGQVAWENSVIQGPRIKEGTEKTDAFRDGTFNSPLYWRKLYVKAETTGVETVDEHECYKVVLTPKEGKPLTHFFDKKTGLLVKTVTTRVTQLGEITAEILSSDYRKEGDILTPHTLTNKFAGQQFDIHVQSVEYNVDMPKDRFDPPEEIQALLKKAVQPAAKAAPAPSVTPAASAGDSGKLTIYMSGKPSATETYTVQRANGKIEVNGSGNATIGPMKIDIEQFKVVTDDKFHPIEATAKAKLGQIQMNVKTTFADGQAKNQIDSGQGNVAKDDAVSPDALVVNANLPLYPWTLLAMRASFKNQDPQQFPVYVIGQAEVPGTLVFKGREPVEFLGKTADLNHLTVNATNPQGQAISLDFWVDDNRKIIKLAVLSMGVEGYQDGYERKAPPEPAKPDVPKTDKP